MPKKDALDQMADDIKATVVDMCAKVAEISAIKRPENQYQIGYNQAVSDIAAMIRKMNAKS